MKGFLVRLYGFSLLQDLTIIFPFYAVMFVDHGLTGMEVSVLFAVWSGTVIVLEVPSGVLADKYSRRWLLVAGQLIRAVGYVCWALYPGFWGFLVGFVLWGIEGAMYSGTFEALVYDELKRFGRESDFVKVIGRSRSFSLVGVIASGAAASAVVTYGYAALLAGSTVTTVAAALVALSLPAAAAVQSTGERRYFALLRAGVRDAIHTPGVARLIVFLSFGTLAGALDEYWPIFAHEAGLPHVGLGLFLAALYAVQALGGVLAHRFEDLPARWFFAAFCAGGLLVLAAAWRMHPAGLVLLGGFVFLFQMIEVVFEGRLQHAIRSDTRATVSSVRGFASEVMGIGVFLGMGGIVGDGPYRDGFLVFGAAATVIGLAYWIGGARFPGDRAANEVEG